MLFLLALALVKSDIKDIFCLFISFDIVGDVIIKSIDGIGCILIDTNRIHPFLTIIIIECNSLSHQSSKKESSRRVSINRSRGIVHG